MKVKISSAVTFALAALCTLDSVNAALVVGPWVPRFKGVDVSISTNIPPSGGDLARRQVVSALRVDLSDPDIQFLTTPRIASNYSENQREIAAYTVSDFLRNNGLQAAVNANFFSDPSYYLPPGTPMDVYGLEISQGVLVSPADSSHAAALMFDAQNQPTIIPTNRPPASTDGVYTAVSGNYPLLVAGRNVGRKLDVDPRTVFGISEDRRYLYLVAIDGRQPGYSDGANDYESAYWLQLLGAYDGINMDGGGSTTLVIEGSTGAPQRINRSSAVADSGRERTVGSHFGIYAKPLPGFINDVAVNPETTSAAISWTTLEPASSEVRYGLSTNLGSSSGLDGSLSTNHLVQLTGLTPDTGYYFQVISAANGQQHLSPLLYFTTTNHVTTNLVFDFTNSWKYSYTPLDGVDWTAPTYNDTDWSGPAPGLLWVDNRATPNPAVQPKNTQMPSDPALSGDPYVTYYFRTHVTLAPMEPGSSLAFAAYIDDGAVFYLNGVEIYRLRVPEGQTWSTLANGFPCSGNADCLDEFRIPVSSLPSVREGDNVLAVEVHNYNLRSGDITFGLALSRIDPITPSEDPTELTIAAGNDGALEITWTGAGGILQSASSVNGTWIDAQTSSTNHVTIRPSEARQFYRVRK
jgi:hypothetical protein